LRSPEARTFGRPAGGWRRQWFNVIWAITTMTTVGFGDIAPRTTIGRALSSVVMLLGWGILAVPTGIVTAEMTSRRLSSMDATDLRRSCPSCGAPVLASDSHFCHRCGTNLG
jgi:voltage-gated potassium channel